MFGIFEIGLGSVLVALGVTWFFKSLLDGLLLSLAGPMAKNGVTPMTKVSLGDNISLLFAGATSVAHRNGTGGTQFPRQGRVAFCARRLIRWFSS